MADSIYLDRDYATNGVVIPAGKVSTDDLRDLLKNENGEHISEAEAKAAQQDLMQRQGKYAQYSKGIHERRERISNAGSVSVGGSD